MVESRLALRTRGDSAARNTFKKLQKRSDMTAVGSSAPSRSPAPSAVGRLFGFQSDGPGVRRHDGSPSMDPAGVNTFVELVGDDAKVPVLHDDVAQDGGQDLLAIFIPAGEESVVRCRDRLSLCGLTKKCFHPKQIVV